MIVADVMYEGDISFCLDKLWSTLQMEKICTRAGLTGQCQMRSLGLQKEPVAKKVRGEYVCAVEW